MSRIQYNLAMIWLVVEQMVFCTKFFVAKVNFDDARRLYVNVNHLSNDNVWNAKYRNRFVLPQLTFSSVVMTGVLFLILFSIHQACDQFLKDV